MFLLWRSQRTVVPKVRQRRSPTHLLIVLGSGGHTAEMISILRRLPLDPMLYTYRTYVVSSGDSFSTGKALEFEEQLARTWRQKTLKIGSYNVITIPRARRVHQSFLTAPVSTIQSLLSCLQVLRGTHAAQKSSSSIQPGYPDLILTNGPATAFCVILAAKILRLWSAIFSPLAWLYAFSQPSGLPVRQEGLPKPLYPLRTVFIESWARVTTFSLSGKLLLPLADRFLVQWPNLEGKRAWLGMRKTEYVGSLVE